ncbi:hypothetical protein Ccrd_009868 [Cynara cardunculus var. scolymus]|uniref:Uncharacterized protein n=1 Tax=Cynara cardunculus var. scolymus TaxID=59895 RepID=A0A124SI66_CYNCS|nr:hypothetical protein Ccrd_009868 [Cynara cardunculus var. scolymus]
MEKKSWVCTVSVQLILCFALYCAINMDQLQTPTYRNGAQGQPDDIYFITVRGGFRPLKQQTRLLKQVIYVATVLYTTMALREEEPEYFFKQVNVSSGIMLDIIALNTGKIQDSSSGIGKGELEGLSRKLELSNSNWHIALGFHPLSCNQTQAEGNGNGVLLEMLLNHGVDAYLSGRSCANEARVGGPHLTTITQESHPPKEMVVNMFLLHRVSPLEIATYGVSFKGDMIHESTLRQRGSEMM